MGNVRCLSWLILYGFFLFLGFKLATRIMYTCMWSSNLLCLLTFDTWSETCKTILGLFCQMHWVSALIGLKNPSFNFVSFGCCFILIVWMSVCLNKVIVLSFEASCWLCAYPSMLQNSKWMCIWCYSSTGVLGTKTFIRLFYDTLVSEN